MATISALGVNRSASESDPAKTQTTLSPDAQQALEAATQLGVVNPTMLAEAVSKLPDEQRSGVAQELNQTLGTEDAKDFNRALTGFPTGGSKTGPQGAEAQDETLLDLTQMGLDLAGIFDPTPICDGLSGIISLARGDWLGAGVSVASMLPYVGDLSKLGKLGKYADTLKNAIDLAKVDKKFAAALKPVLEKLKSMLDQIPLDSLPPGGRELVEGMKSKIDEFLGAGRATAKTLDELDALRGTGDSVGDLSKITGSSIEDIVRNIPQNTTVRKLTPVEGGSQVGLEFKWVDENGVTNRLRMHDPDPSAGVGSNSAGGWTARWQVGKGYFDPTEGSVRHRNVHNSDSPFHDPAAANNTHIPIQSPGAELIDAMRFHD